MASRSVESMGLFSRKKSDMHKLYEACMKGAVTDTLTATETSTAIVSPFSLYCSYHADPDLQDPPDPFQQALSRKGLEHEAAVVESEHPDIREIPVESPQDGFMKMLDSMSAGTEALVQPPMFYLPDCMYGVIDILERRDGDSVFGRHHYVVREIKVALNIKEHHLIQAAFYAKMMGLIQGRRPEYFLITDGNENTMSFRYDEYEKPMEDAMSLARRIMKGWIPPAVYNTGIPPWTGYTNEIAIRNNDISLIPHIGPKMRSLLLDAGLHTVNDVATSSAGRLQKIRGIGSKKSAGYIESARAIDTGRCARMGGNIDLPERPTEIFLDLEGLNATFSNRLTDYLIGAVVRRDGEAAYHRFLAENWREDRMLEEFLGFIDQQDDYVIYHWHSYERNHLKSMMERHGMDGHGMLAPDVMIDLHTVATGAFVFPTYSNSIKDIARWIGFEWRHHDMGATSAIEVYLRYADDPEAYADEMKLVIDYNEDDCRAVMVVKDWLASRAPREAAGA